MFLRHLLLLPFILSHTLILAGGPPQPFVPSRDIIPTTEVFLSTFKNVKIGQYTNCSLSDTVLDLNLTHPTTLPSPSPGLKLKYLAIGLGSQNYTCASAGASAKPTSIGAVATLYDASCALSSNQDLLHALPNLVTRVPMEAVELVATLASLLNPSSLGVIMGVHYFRDASTAFFDFRPSGANDWVAAKKVNNATAPGGYHVPWLKLDSVESNGIKEVFRVHTINGAAPATCQGFDGPFQIGYAAEYWFYG